MRRSLLTIGILLTASGVCEATPAPLKRLSGDVWSPNRAFVAKIDAKTSTAVVFRADDPKKPLWSFKERLEFDKAFLSDDGTALAAFYRPYVHDHALGNAVCVKFWNKDNSRAYAFAELAADPARESAMEYWPVGWWSPGSVNPRKWYTTLEQEGDTIRVRTTDLYEYTFSIADGTIIESRLLLFNLRYKLWFCLLLVVLIVGTFVFFARRMRRKQVVSTEPRQPSAPPSA